jgi:FG-GAP-like repeat
VTWKRTPFCQPTGPLQLHRGRDRALGKPLYRVVPRHRANRLHSEKGGRVATERDEFKRAAWRVMVAAGDVNGDGRPDLYVMRGRSATSTNAPDRVYLNNGTGTNFSLMSSIPSTSEGKAESVWPIDYDGNGLTDFLVLNGDGERSGPVQLIAFLPGP